MQLCGRPLANLGAFLTSQSAGKVMDASSGNVGEVVRSTLRGVLQREHLISSQPSPPLMACSMVGDGSIGPPSAHIRSFQLWQARLSASRISASPDARFSAARSARILVIARALVSSFASAFRSPPDRGVG